MKSSELRKLTSMSTSPMSTSPMFLPTSAWAASPGWALASAAYAPTHSRRSARPPLRHAPAASGPPLAVRSSSAAPANTSRAAGAGRRLGETHAHRARRKPPDVREGPGETRFAWWPTSLLLRISDTSSMRRDSCWGRPGGRRHPSSASASSTRSIIPCCETMGMRC